MRLSLQTSRLLAKNVDCFKSGHLGGGDAATRILRPGVVRAPWNMRNGSFFEILISFGVGREYIARARERGEARHISSEMSSQTVPSMRKWKVARDLHRGRIIFCDNYVLHGMDNIRFRHIIVST